MQSLLMSPKSPQPVPVWLVNWEVSVEMALPEERVSAGGLRPPSRGLGGAVRITLLVGKCRIRISPLASVWAHPEVSPIPAALVSDNLRVDIPFGIAGVALAVHAKSP